MADVGKLTLIVMWDGAAVSGTEIRSTRPMAAQVLRGKTPEQVLRIVPMLFSVCGRAQSAAAKAALHAAQHSAYEIASTERLIAGEAMQEHLWRLLLDWPKLLGLAQQEKLFAGWFALLRKIAAGEIGMDVFLHEFERDGLGMSLAGWSGINSSSALQSWWRESESSVAQVLAKLDELKCDGQCDVGLLPAWSVAEALQACAGKWDANFAARPDWRGVAAETGARTYYADSPLLRDVPSKVLARVLARIMDVVEMASGNAAPRLDVTSPAAGEGIAVVRTARGLLMHHVRLVADKVADYTIVAPTEWNFHPDGAFAQDLRGLQVQDAKRLLQLAQIEALSLDPCVEYEIEVRHA
ncbi:MAG: nickel-dependent hydrogenase large subunit [Sideroxydans sp.]|nr:nickel-dependent hydrogenase large subunit [Sideroxydans sp.]